MLLVDLTLPDRDGNWKPVGSTGAGCQSGRIDVRWPVRDRPPA